MGRHKPDEDLISYLNYNQDKYTLDEIVDVLAMIPGHNDEDYWYWVLKLKGSRFALTKAWCDYTGWDCQSGGETGMANTAMKATLFAPRKEYGRDIRLNLINQIRGKQPFGLEVYGQEESPVTGA